MNNSSEYQQTLNIRRPLQSVERVRLRLHAYNIQPFPSPTPRSKAQKRTSIQPAQVARQLESRNPTLRAPRQLESRIWVPGCLNLVILSSSIGDLLRRNSSPQAATGRPTPWPQDPANLPKSVLPPAQECQPAHLGTLADPAESRGSHKLARTIPSDTTGDPRHPKCNQNWYQICHRRTRRQSSKHPSIQAFKPRVLEVGGRGGSLFNI